MQNATGKFLENPGEYHSPLQCLTKKNFMHFSSSYKTKTPPRNLVNFWNMGNILC